MNQLEALAEWGVFSKLKAPFYLYVPPQSIDSARRICEEQQFPVAEILDLPLVHWIRCGLPRSTVRQTPPRPRPPQPPAPSTTSRQRSRPSHPRKAAEAGGSRKIGQVPPTGTAKNGGGEGRRSRSRRPRPRTPAKSRPASRIAKPVKAAKPPKAAAEAGPSRQEAAVIEPTRGVNGGGEPPCRSCD